MPQLTIKVDHSACSGIGSCVQTAPQFFQLDSENRALVISKESGEALAQQHLTVTEAEATEIIRAAESCPMIAISIHDANGKQIYG